MDRIKQIYQTLSKSEVKALKAFLEMIHSKGENKPLELILAIEKKPGLTAEVASEKLYGDSKSKAFIMMKARLHDRILDFLCFLASNDSLAPNERYFDNHIRYRKAALQAIVLRDRKLRNLAIPVLQDAVDFARKCQAPEWELDALNQLRSINRPTLEVFEDLTQQLGTALSQVEVELNATGLYAKYLYLNSNRTQLEKGIEFLARHTPELESAIQQTYSPKADFFLQMMRFHLSSYYQEYGESRKILQKWIDLLKQYPGLQTENRIHEPFYQLGAVELKLGNYDASIHAFQNIINAHSIGERNRYRTMTMLLYPILAKNDLLRGAEIVAELDGMPEPNPLYADEKFISIYLYLKACHLYQKRDLAQTWNLIQEAIDKSFEKEGLIVGLKIFEIMVLIERNMPDIASQKLESFRKHIARYGCDERSRVIFKLLTGQDKKGFEFLPFKAEAELLESLEKEHEWQVSGHEVMRFDVWYRAQTLAAKHRK
jgi:hypothetical protein